MARSEKHRVLGLLAVQASTKQEKRGIGGFGIEGLLLSYDSQRGLDYRVGVAKILLLIKILGLGFRSLVPWLWGSRFRLQGFRVKV